MSRARVIKKRVERAVSGVLSLGYVLSHARPSFWLLRDVGQQRRYLRQRLTARIGSRGLGMHPNLARYITHKWLPADWQAWRHS